MDSATECCKESERVRQLDFNANFQLCRKSAVRTSAVNRVVARPTDGDQIVFAIKSSMASERLMMNLQILHAAAHLAAPAVAIQNAIAQLR
jgi:hypothetical protein